MFFRRNFCLSLLSLILFFCAGCFNFRSSIEKFDLASVSRDENVIPVLILGGGCAGLYAAVYCAQANIPCVVIEGPKPGGSLAQSHSVRNWPGVIDLPGADIINGVRAQAERNHVCIAQEKVIKVDMRAWPRVITTQNIDNPTQMNSYKALSVIIALGTEPNLLEIPGETGSDGYWGRGVSNCAVCEGSLYGGKNVAIVGGGDAAIVEADYLSNIAANVTLLLRSNAFRAKDIKARDCVLAKPNVRVLFNTEISEIRGDGHKMTHVVTVNNATGEHMRMDLHGLFLAIGSKPNTVLFKDQLALDDKGLIALTDYQETSLRGVYAAGDVCDGEFMQGATALGDACKAALQAWGFLKELGFDAVTWGKRAQKPVVEKLRETIEVREITSRDDFEKYVLNSKRPVVVDVFATWCIPCQQMGPVIDASAQTLRDRIVFVKINIQNKSFDAQAAIKRLSGADVQGVPAFLCVHGGKEIGRLVGFKPQEQFMQGVMSIFNIT